MAFIVETIGPSAVILDDLGFKYIPHPTFGLDLSLEYNESELKSSTSVRNAISVGTLKVTRADGSVINSLDDLDQENTKVKDNYASLVDPLATDDVNQGYSIGSRWINTVTNEGFICVDNAVGIAIWRNITFDPVQSVGPFAQTISVSGSGGDYVSIKSALDSILDSSTNKRYTVLVYPGNYTELPMTVPNYVTIVGIGSDESVRVIASNLTSPLFTLGNDTSISNISISGASGVGGIGVLCNSIDVDGGELYQVLIDGCETAIKIDLGTTARIIGCVINNSGLYDISLNNVSDVLKHSASIFDNFKIIKVSGSRLIGMSFSETQGDEGLQIHGELHVGRHDDQKESVFGGGDSHTIGMNVIQNTNGEVGTWSDVTTQAKSASGSTFALLPGNTINNSVYIGGDLAFPGIKVNVTTLMNIGTGSLLAQYWNGTGWINFNHLSTTSNAPYTQWADKIFERQQSDQIRFGFDTNLWTKKILNGINKYWIRFLVNSAITGSPSLEQIKIHTNRSEINGDGLLEYFGDARQLRTFFTFPGQFLEIDAVDRPGDFSISPSTNITLRTKNNVLSDGKDTSVAGVVVVPDGLSTDKDIDLEFFWSPSLTVTGDVEFRFIYSIIKQNDIFGALSEFQFTNIVTIAVASKDKLIKNSFTFNIPSTSPGDIIMFSLGRDATSGNANDTLVSDVYLSAGRVQGYFWR